MPGDGNVLVNKVTGSGLVELTFFVEEISNRGDQYVYNRLRGQE